MPAATEAELYNLEAFEDAIVSAMEAEGIPAGGRRTIATETWPQVNVRLTTEQVEGRRFNRWPGLPSQLQPYNTWLFTLTCDIETERGASNNAAHQALVSQVRLACQFYKIISSMTVARMPYHSITDIREVPAECEADSERNLDRTRLAFSGMINIKDSAWPA